MNLNPPRAKPYRRIKPWILAALSASAFAAACSQPQAAAPSLEPYSPKQGAAPRPNVPESSYPQAIVQYQPNSAAHAALAALKTGDTIGSSQSALAPLYLASQKMGLSVKRLQAVSIVQGFVLEFNKPLKQSELDQISNSIKSADSTLNFIEANREMRAQ